MVLCIKSDIACQLAIVLLYIFMKASNEKGG